MIRFFSSVLSLLLVTFAAAQAFAGPPDDAKAALTKAREGLVALLEADASKQAALQTEIATATKSVDAAVGAALADKATGAEQAKAFKEFKKTWDEFKKTRDGEIIPAIKSGKKDAAKALAKGIQAERFKKLNELLAAAGAK